MNFTIREYQNGDAAEVMELLARLQGDLAKVDPMEFLIPYEDFSAEAYMALQVAKVQTNSGRMFVAEVGGKVEGVILGWINNSVNGDIEYKPGKGGFVSDLYVDEKHRHAGVGKDLVEAMEKYFKEQACEYVALTYLKANEGVGRFYEELGYADYSAKMTKRL